MTFSPLHWQLANAFYCALLISPSLLLVRPIEAQHEHHAGAAAASMVPVEHDPHFLAELVTAAQSQGDARRGMAVFRAAKFACLSCHQVGAHGGNVGPALSDVGKRLKAEEIAEAVLWPKRQVKPEYVAWRVRLVDGRTLQGYKRGEAPDKLELFDTAAQRTQLLTRADIDQIREAGTLMPDGLASAMTAAQRRDVVRFLIELGRTPGLAEQMSAPEVPAEFAYDRGPLDPAAWPLWQHSVNRDRLYDFYLKAALFFRSQTHRPHLLPAFPGLDGGQLGHWGNQNEEVWKDDRWNATDLGTVLAGVFHGPGGLVVPKAVCVRLGERGEMAACFNPETLRYEALWEGGFLKFSAVRHGFLDGLHPAGTPLPRPAGEMPPKPFVYRGFYRYGPRVAFAYRLGEVEMLDAPWVKDGKFERVVAPAAEHPLRQALAGGPPQWPQKVAGTHVAGTRRVPSADKGESSERDDTRSVPATKSFDGTRSVPTTLGYVVESIPLPFDNPWKALLFIGDHDFLPDGTAIVATMTGDVWRSTGLDEPLAAVRWRRFASGLHQPQGVVVHDGQIYVLGRDQITRLEDLNRDGEADYYECFSNVQLTSPAGHDFICGLARDKQGRFYAASGKQGLLRISSDGKRADVLATGFRNPDGLGLMPDGAITVPCSEGDWTPASMICLVPPKPDQTSPPHFGYGGPIGGQPPALPMVYLPRGLDNSSGGQVFAGSGTGPAAANRFGPLSDQILHFSFGQGSALLVLRDQVAGQPQGAVVPLPWEFRSGAHRGKINPKDGQLYVSGMAGWGSYTPDDGCLHRVRYTGQPVQLPQSLHIHENGVRLTFSEPVDRAAAASLDKHFAQVWNYRYGPGYGSPELAPTHPGVVGHEALEIAGVHVLDERTLFVELPDLQPVNQLHLVLDLGGARPQELFITVHKLDEPFAGIPGFRPAAKTIAAHPQAVDLAMLGKTVRNPWEKRGPKPPAVELEIAAGKNLTFSTRTLRCRAGERVKLTFINPDVVPHNWVLIQPETLAAVGDLANKLVADPEAVLRQYVPKTGDVIVHTDIVPPQQSHVIYFDAPRQPGRYPYLCTFPGHWMVMNGELVVEAE